ncbi:MAG: amino acid ABC transporter substrate-binding protein [Anaerolineae bacterium]|nr:amino acid ABC transporter substrate-binding protein [Anaerolineae bacterium]
MSRKLFPFFAALVLLALVVTACGGGGDTSALQGEIDSLQSDLDAANAKLEEAMAMPAETETMEVAVTFAGGGDTLAKVQGLGVLNCGVSGGLPGFSVPDADGNMTGFDWDYCRVVAAAALGNADAAEARPSNASERFPILQSGEIDVLIRNTTWTVSRDTSLGFNFAPTTFYDGQGMAVRKDSGIDNLEGLDGGTVCVNAGTTTEKNLADVFRSRGISYEPVVFAETADVRGAYDEGRCDGWTTDKSGLVASITILADPTAHKILDETMSKEPLGPLVRHGDDNWFDIVKWSVNCTILAEDLGVTSANVDDMLGADDPQILNLLGVEGDLGQAMGLNNDFCYQIIAQVGNYGEIFEANLGVDTPFGLTRGLNAQWTNGGILYSPPFR